MWPFKKAKKAARVARSKVKKKKIKSFFNWIYTAFKRSPKEAKKKFVDEIKETIGEMK